MVATIAHIHTHKCCLNNPQIHVFMVVIAVYIHTFYAFKIVINICIIGCRDSSHIHTFRLLEQLMFTHIRAVIFS